MDLIEYQCACQPDILSNKIWQIQSKLQEVPPILPDWKISIIGSFEFLTKSYKIEARMGSSKFYPQNLTHVIKIWLLSGQEGWLPKFSMPRVFCSTANYNGSSKTFFYSIELRKCGVCRQRKSSGARRKTECSWWPCMKNWFSS